MFGLVSELFITILWLILFEILLLILIGLVLMFVYIVFAMIHNTVKLMINYKRGDNS